MTRPSSPDRRPDVVPFAKPDQRVDPRKMPKGLRNLPAREGLPLDVAEGTSMRSCHACGQWRPAEQVHPNAAGTPVCAECLGLTGD